MNKNHWNHNGEGYTDRTASIAIQHILKEERKNAMAKRRSCRRTTDETIIHEKAVKMRRMTDEQLVHYVEDRVEKARSEGYHQGKKTVKPVPKINIKDIVEEISGIKGIGASKLKNIKEILEIRLVGDEGV